MNAQQEPLFFWNYAFDTIAYDHRIATDLMYGSKQNLQKLTTLVNRLFDRRSNLLFIRIDLGYKHEVAHAIPIELAQKHRERLLGDRRYFPELFKGFMGYAWCFECSEKSGGYHYHLLLIFDGSERRDDIGIGWDFKDLWDMVITNGFGNAYVVNQDKWKFEKKGVLGIGMIHRDEVHKRINLIEKVLPYIAKKCPFADIQSPHTDSGYFRTFNMSKMPAPIDPNVPRRGRPPMNGW